MLTLGVMCLSALSTNIQLCLSLTALLKDTYAQVAQGWPCAATLGWRCTGCWHWRSGCRMDGGGWCLWPVAAPDTAWMSQEHQHTPGGRKQGKPLVTSVQCADPKTARACMERGNQNWTEPETELTLSMYSTLIMRHCRIEGPTGGILMARPCQVSRHLVPTMSPHSVATTERFCFMVPRAMNVWVWVM